MPYRIAIAIWLVAFFGMLCVIGLVVRAPQLIKLSNDSRQTPGTVTATLPNSHGSIIVRYRVDGKNYEQKFGPYPWEAGAQVTVYYSLSDATISEVSEPRQRLLHEAASGLAISVLAASGLLAGILFLTRAWRRTGSPASHWLSGPRLASSSILAGVLGGTISSAIFGQIDAPRGVASSFLVGSAALFTYCAWRSKAGWERLIRLKSFWIASGLAIIGIVVERLAG